MFLVDLQFWACVVHCVRHGYNRPSTAGMARPTKALQVGRTVAQLAPVYVVDFELRRRELTRPHRPHVYAARRIAAMRISRHRRELIPRW